MAGFLSKAISEQKARTRPDADEGNGSYMVPTSMACPAAGCPFPCDTGRNGRFLCSFHTGVQSQYWPLVTEIRKGIGPSGRWPSSLPMLQRLGGSD